jgi:hypothetical protein
MSKRKLYPFGLPAAARKPHRVHTFHFHVAGEITVIIRMRRSIADIREGIQRSDSFPETNLCLAAAPKP